MNILPMKYICKEKGKEAISMDGNTHIIMLKNKSVLRSNLSTKYPQIIMNRIDIRTKAASINPRYLKLIEVEILTILGIGKVTPIPLSNTRLNNKKRGKK